MLNKINSIIIPYVLSVILCAFFVFPPLSYAAADTLSWEEASYLEDNADREVTASIIHFPGKAKEIVKHLGIGSYIQFDFIDVLIVRVKGKNLLEINNHPAIIVLEPIEDGLAKAVTDMLTQLFRVALYDNLNLFELGVLNISIGVPKAFLGKKLSADRTIHKALSNIVANHEIPVVMSIGNDGPLPGLINPWALANGVIVVGATDKDGSKLWERSSRGQEGEMKGHTFVVAHGENTIGPWPLGVKKSLKQIKADKAINLAAIVGPENADKFSVKSGTSFAAAKVSSCACQVQYAMQMLRARLSGQSSVELTLKPFVRGYIDTGIDRKHPAFHMRLVDERFHYGNIKISIHPDQKSALTRFFTSNAINIRIRYNPELLVNFFRKAARPIKGYSFDEVGYGFLSFEVIQEALMNLRLSTVIDLFAPPEHPRRSEWLAAAAREGDPKVFELEDLKIIGSYCSNYDLILALPLDERMYRSKR